MVQKGNGSASPLTSQEACVHCFVDCVALTITVAVQHIKRIAMTTDCTTRDEFRLMEKRIKNYGRNVLANQSNKSKRQKLKMNAGRDESETNFAWSEVLDVCNTSRFHKEERNHRFVDEKNMSEVSNSCSVFDLSSVCPGLYIVSQALSIEQQIYWATKAVEEYSTVEHNNLNNLHSIYDIKSTDEKLETETEPKDSVKGSIPDIPSVEDLWTNSTEEDVPFESFSKLRWSCLGYHYGKLVLFNDVFCFVFAINTFHSFIEPTLSSFK